MTETMQELIHRAISTGIKIKIPRKDWIFQWDKDRLVFKSNLDYCSYSPNVMLDFSELQEYIEPPKLIATTFYAYHYIGSHDTSDIFWLTDKDADHTYHHLYDNKGNRITKTYYVRG